MKTLFQQLQAVCPITHVGRPAMGSANSVRLQKGSLSCAATIFLDYEYDRPNQQCQTATQ